MKISDQTKKLAEQLWQKSSQEARFYPVDRPFLKPYLDQIKAVDPAGFVSHNLTTYSGLYATQLLTCLPELWEALTVDDIVEVIESFHSEQPFYSFILFTYKYLQVDMLRLILESPTVSDLKKQKIKGFLKAQYPHLILQEDEWEDFEDGALGIGLDDWVYARQKLLTDARVRPAKRVVVELRAEVESL
ncbi:MAG: hypothetical protein H6557_16385 [Lewinellaceae bacterium]|nr:hypothetical protein [Phaeodactylibacter sp.]MCB9038195.1 hypothetical protein [Lewinellaceae bacterium]